MPAIQKQQPQQWRPKTAEKQNFSHKICNWNWSLPLTDGLPARLPAKSIQQQRKKQDISTRRHRSVSSNFVQTKKSCQWSISKEFFQIISIIINPTFFLGLFSTADRTIQWQVFNSHKKIKIKVCVSQGIYYSYSYSYYFIQETKKNHKNLYMCLLPILLSFLLLSLQQIVLLHPNSLVVMPVSIIMKNQAECFFCTWLELLRGFLRMSVDCPKCDQKESNKIEPRLCNAIGVFGIYDKSFLEFHSATKRTCQDSM